MKKFYDTCSLLLAQEKAFDEPFVIAIQTLEEIEGIKTSSRKDEQVKFQARRMAHLLDENSDKYEVSIITATEDNIEVIKERFSIAINNDVLIMFNAFVWNEGETIQFISDDINCKVLARNVFKLDVASVKDQKDDSDEYEGYKIADVTDEQLAKFYENPTDNRFECLQNEYILLKLNGEIVDKRKWDGEKYIATKVSNIKSNLFGSVKPLDDYQALILDSFATNKISMIKGSAGSGKSYLSIGYLFSQLEKHKIDKIIVFCNTVATMGSAKLGYYPGTKDQKLIDSQIGNMVASKLGDKIMVESLINEGKLVLLPMSDIRGYDTTNMNAGIYITEAQNLSVSLMKLAVQRIGEDCICILDGDCKTQVDDINFAGSNNGMRRLSEVFRGTDVYGEITLNKVYRSRIAEIAESM